jgi:hypothetical protein
MGVSPFFVGPEKAQATLLRKLKGSWWMAVKGRHAASSVEQQRLHNKR